MQAFGECIGAVQRIAARSDAVACDAATGVHAVRFGRSVSLTNSPTACVLIVVGTCGAFVAAFRKRAEIVFADVDRQPPNSAARRSRWALIRSAAVAWWFPSIDGWCESILKG